MQLAIKRRATAICPVRRTLVRPAFASFVFSSSEDEEVSRTPVLSAPGRVAVATPSEALSTVAQAISHYGSEGARVEYCRWHGVDYERTLTYVAIVQALDCALKALDDVRPPNVVPLLLAPPKRPQEVGTPTIEVVRGGGNMKLRVRIDGVSDDAFNAMVRMGCCPLCRQKIHTLSMCPLLPNELRPFC